MWRQNMITWKTALKLFARFLLYSLIVILIDFILITVLKGEGVQIKYTLSFVMLIEGGIGLIIGGATVLYSPSVGKVIEVLFNSKPWNSKQQNETEEQAKGLIITGTILIFEALILSALWAKVVFLYL